MGALFGLIFLVFWLGLMFLMGFMWWKIVKKTGYHGALGILMLVPIANIIMMAILAFRDWPIHKEWKEGEARPSSSLSAPLIVVIVLVAAISIMALLAAIAIPNFLRARIYANEASAEVKVKTISTAIETYAFANNGKYPPSEYELKSYLTDRYDNQTLQGYKYSLNLNPNGYEIIATPESCQNTGFKIFKASTGGAISKSSCK